MFLEIRNHDRLDHIDNVKYATVIGNNGEEFRFDSTLFDSVTINANTVQSIAIKKEKE